MLRPVLTSLFVLMAPAAGGFTAEDLPQPFDPSRLDKAAKLFLQTALAYEADYDGLLDGIWGQRSAEAIAAYAVSKGAVAPTNDTAVELAGLTLRRMQRGGWERGFVDDLGLSLLLPRDRLPLPDQGDGMQAYAHARSTMAFAYGVSTGATPAEYHDTAAVAARGLGDTYEVRRDRLWVTSGTNAEGRLFYTRSDRLDDGWATVTFSVDPGSAGILHAMAGSIVAGTGTPIELSDGTLRKGLDVREGAEADADPVQIASGIVVSSAGYVMTAASAVRECSAIQVGQFEPAEVIVDEAYGLALLKVPGLSGRPAASFAALPASLSSDVTLADWGAFGGVLVGLNLTDGVVASLTGPDQSMLKMQVSAADTGEGSGGPVLDMSGAVVGVQLASAETGETALHGAAAMLFLAQNGVQPQAQTSAEVLDPGLLSERLQSQSEILFCD